MRHLTLAAIGAIFGFVAWCALIALRPPHPTADNELLLNYVVEPAATTTTVPPAGETRPLVSTGTGLPSLADPVVVVVSPVRLPTQQVTATDPPPPRPATLAIPHYDAWQLLARCESGGDWQINTGNGYYGGLQFSLQSWKGAGGLQYAAYPHQASPAQQMLTAERLYQLQGWRAWPSCSSKVGLR